MTDTPKIWTPEDIRALLIKSDRAVERGIVAIYNRQTEDEKEIEETTVHNGIGFSGAHANSGSYFARWILSGRNLSGKHLDKARNLIVKYRKQLANIANEGTS